MACKSYVLALTLCLATVAAPAHGIASKDCSSLGVNVEAACGDIFRPADDIPGLSSYDNSSLTDVIKSTGGTIDPECCAAHTLFLGASCRCSPFTESLLQAQNVTNQEFRNIVYATAIACRQIGTTLYDPEYQETCNSTATAISGL
ncbi:hypothetical protein WJX73_010872 [Symbiochloris irregularis]|uniref:Uncharacterized protein n=1 Tax=Symbiochloris irregularis TaxID=706552 RepID=A0AAW1PRZ8_9CHLO